MNPKAQPQMVVPLEEPSPAPGSRKRMVVLAALLLLLIGGVVGGALWWNGKGKDEGPPPASNVPPPGPVAGEECSDDDDPKYLDPLDFGPPIEVAYDRSVLEALADRPIPDIETYPWQPQGLVAVLGEHRMRGNRVAASPDRTQLAVASTGSHFIRIGGIDTLHEKTIIDLSSFRTTPVAMAWSPRGDYLAVSCRDGQVRLFDVSDLGKIPGPTTLEKRAQRIGAISFSGDGKYLIGADGESIGSAWVWDLATRKIVNQLKHIGPVQSVAFSPAAGDYRALTGGGPVDGQLHLWDALAGTETAVDFRPNKLDTTVAVGDVEISPDGKFALSCHSDQSVRIWDLARFGEGKELHVLKNLGTGLRAAFSPDGKQAATAANSGGGLWLWDIQTGKKIRQLVASRRIATLMFLAGPAGALSKDEPVSAGDHRIVLTEGRGQASNVHVYEVATGKELNPPIGHLGDVTCVELSPTGAGVASGSVDHTLRLWDMKEVEQRHQVNVGVTSRVGYHPDAGRVFVFGPGYPTLAFFDVAGGQSKTPRYNGGHSGAVMSADITRDGRYAVTGGHDGMVYMWQLSDGKLVRDFDFGRGQGAAAVTVCPDMRRALRVGGGKTRLLHLRCRQVLHEWNQVAWAPFLPDARAIFFAKSEAEVWKVTGDKQEKTETIDLDLSGMSRGYLSANGKRVAGLIGRGVSVFDLDARVQVWQWTPPAHFGDVRDVALSPDGDHLLTANGDGTVYVIRINQ